MRLKETDGHCAMLSQQMLSDLRLTHSRTIAIFPVADDVVYRKTAQIFMEHIMTTESTLL